MTNLNHGSAVGPKGEGRDSPSTYPAYSEYKDSGVEWLGKIPIHWAVASLKLLIDVRDGTHETPSYVEPDIESFPLVTSKDVTKGKLIFEKCKHISKEDYLSIIQRSKVSVGDILMPMIGTVGSPILVKEDKEFAIKNLALFKTAKNRGGNAIFLNYFLQSNECNVQFSLETKGGVQNFVSLGALRGLGVTKLSLEEQTQIATFLDRETQKIDRLIEKQQQLIKLLQEKRQAVISHAVTKGLNPDAKMKESGVEWLGKIPEHWEIKRYKHALALFQGAAFKSSEYVADSDVVNIRMGNIKKGGFIDLKHNVKYLPGEYRNSYSKYELKEGDLIVAMTDMSPSLDFLAVPAYMVGLESSKAYLLNQRVGKLIVNNSFSTGYVKYLLLSNNLRSQLKAQGLGTVQSNMSSENLYSSFFVAPSLNEQEKIVIFLDKEDVKIGVLVDKCNNAIQLLKERRTALISAAVTGKIDVRNLVNG